VKVGGELSLAEFGCNLKRALAVVGLEKLIAALKHFNPNSDFEPLIFANLR
jgi:hypothetical protein